LGLVLGDILADLKHAGGILLFGFENLKENFDAFIALAAEV